MVRGSAERSDYYNNFAAELGKDELEELEVTDLVFETISYCQEGLGVFRNSLRSGRNLDETQQRAKSVINHDFLVLKLSHKHELKSLLYLSLFAIVLSVFQGYFSLVLVIALFWFIIYKFLKIQEENHNVLAYHIGIPLFQRVFPVVFRKVFLIVAFLYLFYAIMSLCGWLEEENQSRPAYYIRAEKFAKGPDSLEGIHLKILEEQEYSEIKPLCRIYRIKLCTNIRFLDVKGLLEKVGSDYDIRKANCWDYARMTIKYILEACIERAGCEVHRRKLQKELTNVEDNIVKFHTWNIFERIWSYFWNAGSSK